MSLPPVSTETIAHLIEASGFPFEIEVARTLQSAGYDVRLSAQYFNATRQRAAEVDIRATRDFRLETTHAGIVRTVLELVVECKDNGLPYVLFGFPAPSPPEPGMLDGDLFYLKLRSTQDDAANKLAFIALGDSGTEHPKPMKEAHHQFASPIRFHQAVSVEPKDGKLKFNVSNQLRDALHALAGYVQFVQNTMVTANRGMRQMTMPYDSTVWITFLLLVHRGEHYRFTGPGSLAPAGVTTLFTSLYDSDLSVPFAVDFVKASDLPAALNRIEHTFDLLAAQVLRYLAPSSKPLRPRA